MKIESVTFVCFRKTNNYYKDKKNFDIKRQARPQIVDKKNKKTNNSNKYINESCNCDSQKRSH